MSQIQIRIDEKTKKEAQKLCESMGLTLSGAIKLFLGQMITQKGLPFSISAEKTGGKTEKSPLRQAQDLQKTNNKPTNEWSPFTQRKIG